MYHKKKDEKRSRIIVGFLICDTGSREPQVRINEVHDSFYVCGRKAKRFITDRNSISTNIKRGTCCVGNNQSTNNATGFGALPAGYHRYNGYDYFGHYAYFWSATEASSGYAWYRRLGYGFAHVNRYSYGKDDGYSVRCLRD